MHWGNVIINVVGITIIVLWLIWATWVIWGPDVVSALIRRAKRTPYYHLTGYMNRWWLVPYRREVKRKVNVAFFWAGRWGVQDGETNDGTGPVAFRERPIAWLLQRRDIAVRVHEILRSDTDPAPHDHPWLYITWIFPFVNLHGYWESRYDAAGNLLSTKYHGPGSILFRRATSLHRLEMSGPVFTLFITFKKRGTWGFNVKGKIVPWREYLGIDDSIGRK